jgi:hypothetical protein
MYCLSRFEELRAHLETVQKARGEELHVLQQSSERDLRRLPGAVR